MRAWTTFALLATSACAMDYGLTSGPKDPTAGDDTDAAYAIDTDGDPAADTDDSGAASPDTLPDDTDAVPVASAPIYAQTRDTLFTVDPQTGAVSEVAKFTSAGKAIDGMVDIAIDAQGRLFGGDRGAKSGGPYTLYRIDPTTAVSTPVCTVTVEPTALTFTSSGLLVAAGAGTLTTIDVDGGCDMEVVFEKAGWDTSGDVVGLPDGLLYWTIRGTGSDVLVTVDPVTKQQHTKGDVGFERLYGLGYDQGQGRLYGFSADGDVVEVNPSTGDGTLLTQDANRAWWGATTNPVVWTP